MIPDLDAMLAAEQHLQGRPYLADPEHCGRCASVDRAWEQAVCRHDNSTDVTAFGSLRRQRICSDCGALFRLTLTPYPGWDG